MTKSATVSVLTVEDEDLIRRAYNRILCTPQFRLRQANGVHEARNALTSDMARGLNVVILDLHLGDGSGAELYQEFRDFFLSHEIGVILATSSWYSPEVEIFTEDGRVLLQKPFGKEGLLEAIRRSNRRARLQPGPSEPTVTG